VTNPLLILGVLLFVGYVFGEVAEKVRLPKVTGYILAGICLNPRWLHLISERFAEHTGIVTDVSLAFITFEVGGSLVYSRIRKLGRVIVAITVLEAECALLFVGAGFALLLPVMGVAGLPAAAWLPLAILLGTLASPTDPTATLAVAHEYKAKGQVASTIMGVAALDDVFGIVNYSVGVAVALLLLRAGGAGLAGSLGAAGLEIVGGIGVGAAFGFAFIAITRLTGRESEGDLIVLVFALLGLCFGVARALGVDELLGTMTMGAVVANFCPLEKTVFRILARYTEELIFVFFFTLSGMHLDFSVLSRSLGLVALFVALRAAGKLFGAFAGASLASAPRKVKHYAALGLIPQGGIVIGLALLVKANPAFAGWSDVLVGVVIGATVLHELIGPILSRAALKMAGEISPHQSPHEQRRAES